MSRSGHQAASAREVCGQKCGLIKSPHRTSPLQCPTPLLAWRWRRETRNIPPVISTIVMLRLFARRQRASMSALFYQFVDTTKRPWPTSRPAAGLFPVGRRVARSLPERWPAVRCGEASISGSRPSTRAPGGAARSLPLSNREREWTPGRATLLCLRAYRSSAQESP
jgi:hypothetical protein